MSSNKSENKSEYGQILKDTYLKYEEFGFLKNKKIRFPIIFAFLFFGIFWNGAEVPDFENAPRQITVGKYHCPLVGGRGYGNAKIDDIPYYHDWSKVFGFWHRSSSCSNSNHKKILAIEWIQFRDKRIVTSIYDPVNGRAIPGYYRQLKYLKENASSNTGVYLWRLASVLIALLLLVKTDWKTQGDHK